MLQYELPSKVGTRMLLRSDGSTTLLLESLLNTSLQVAVPSQKVVRTDEVEADILQWLCVESGEPLLVRHSALVTPAQEVVSRNYVVARTQIAESLLTGMEQEELPLGKLLLGERWPQYRQLLGHGTREFTFDAVPSTCAFKHYVIWLEQKPLLYIRELFHPKFVAAHAFEE
ncbi:chorismate pyruvate-lyase family protein [Brevibacillus fulvus]|uniref:Chorismate-pyruvate lyase n=1 Tax=Brevibacillus fulvus TaxID=1125967 RepID=A0A939BNU1_9BACL|nr:chorismate pyruvate-lyase family protein [Brevibacillus fulvus]MBM7589635.1 chorismate-pyruvate lyase [Brevibacillus fulvus]